MTVSNESEPDDLRRLARDFERLAEELARSPRKNPYDAVTRLAVQRVPKARAVSVTVAVQDRFVTVGCSDELGRRADTIQYELGSGPCVDAIVDQTVYALRDLETEGRWPQFSRRVAAEFGLRSMLSFHMNMEQAGLLAGLNFYAEEPDTFDERDLSEGLLVTTHAAQVLAAAQLRARTEKLEQALRLETENVQLALRSTREIGMAIGVLVARYGLTRVRAFDLLRIASEDTKRRVHDIALDVIDTGTLDIAPDRRD